MLKEHQYYKEINVHKNQCSSIYFFINYFLNSLRCIHHYFYKQKCRKLELSFPSRMTFKLLCTSSCRLGIPKRPLFLHRTLQKHGFYQGGLSSVEPKKQVSPCPTKEPLTSRSLRKDYLPAGPGSQ